MTQAESPPEWQPHEQQDNWWSRPCGGRDVLMLALPLVISTGSWSLMHFADRLFLTWYHADAMAASMPAGLLFFTMLCLPIGVASYVNTFVAQYHGAGQPERIGPAVGQGLRIGLLLLPIYLAIIPFGQQIFDVIGHPPEIRGYEISYFRVVLWGAGAAIMSEAMTAYFTGRGRTSTVMVVNLSAALLNVVLDYLLIFGCRGVVGLPEIPEMGIVGAAVATVCAQWSRVLLYVVIMVANKTEWHKHNMTIGLLHFDKKLMRRLLYFGMPNGLQLVIEIGAFSLFVLLVGRLGDLEMASTTLAFTINTLAFLPLLGMSIAVGTLVGQQLGANRPDMADRAVWTSYYLALGYMGTMVSLYALVPGLFLMLHGAFSDPQEFASIKDATIVLLRFVALYSLLDATMMVFVGALRGAGDTRFILIVSILMSVWPVPVAAVGIYWFGLGLYWCWSVITVWIGLLGLVYLLRYLQGTWRTMRVIEGGQLGDGSVQASTGAESVVVSPDNA